MAAYDSNHVKNIALLGHAGSGKTTLAESMLFEAGRCFLRDWNHKLPYNIYFKMIISSLKQSANPMDRLKYFRNFIVL